MKPRLKLSVLYSDDYGERFIGNLINFYGFCRACETFNERLYCDNCRYVYGSYAGDFCLVSFVSKPNVPFIDEPESILPPVPKCDVLVAVALHPDLLLALPSVLARGGLKALIVPVEDPAWLSPGLARQIREECSIHGLECSFPKPFCSIDNVNNGSVIDGFVAYFKIGKPVLDIEVSGEIVRDVKVLRSSPCGSTWYIAKRMVGCTIDELPDVVSKAHHAYPCTASMAYDQEIGDTILHKAGHIIFEAIYRGISDSEASLKLLKVLREREIFVSS